MVFVGGVDGSSVGRRAGGLRLDGTRNIRVVVQKGRSFQRANPHVPVVVDRGRFLVVELPGGIDVEQVPARFTIAEAQAGPLGFRVERAAPAARRPDVAAILGRISAADLQRKVESLAALRTRFSQLPVFAGRPVGAYDVLLAGQAPRHRRSNVRASIGTLRST